MKKLKWTILVILPLLALIATIQSGWAPGKAATNLIDLNIFDPTAGGTKFFVKLTIYYVPLEPNEISCLEVNDARTKLMFLSTVTKGNDIFAFSYEGDEVCYVDVDSEIEEIEKFAEALVAHITGLADPLPEYSVKSIGDFVDTSTSLTPDGIVLGQNQPPSGELTPGFKMVDLVLAIKE